MAFSMLPSIIVDALTDLTPDFLAERGIELLMLDFDNTIVPYTTDIPEPLMEQWLYDMKMSEIKLCVVSNSKNQRVRIFCKNYGIDCITHAKSPSPRGSGRVCSGMVCRLPNVLWPVIRSSPTLWAPGAAA